jgi:hypothetical protein
MNAKLAKRFFGLLRIALFDYLCGHENHTQPFRNLNHSHLHTGGFSFMLKTAG